MSHVTRPNGCRNSTAALAVGLIASFALAPPSGAADLAELLHSFQA